MRRDNQIKQIDGVKVMYSKGYRLTALRKNAVKMLIKYASEIYQRRTYAIFLNLDGFGPKNQISIILNADMYDGERQVTGK